MHQIDQGVPPNHRQGDDTKRIVRGDHEGFISLKPLERPHVRFLGEGKFGSVHSCGPGAHISRSIVNPVKFIQIAVTKKLIKKEFKSR